MSTGASDPEVRRARELWGDVSISICHCGACGSWVRQISLVAWSVGERKHKISPKRFVMGFMVNTILAILQPKSWGLETSACRALVWIKTPQYKKAQTFLTLTNPWASV